MKKEVIYIYLLNDVDVHAQHTCSAVGLNLAVPLEALINYLPE